MNLKMYEFDGGVKVYICAENETQAISLFKEWHGEDNWKELVEAYGDEAIREMPSNESFTYYHDGYTPEEATIDYLIKKYCGKPTMFASSIF